MYTRAGQVAQTTFISPSKYCIGVRYRPPNGRDSGTSGGPILWGRSRGCRMVDANVRLLALFSTLLDPITYYYSYWTRCFAPSSILDDGS